MIEKLKAREMDIKDTKAWRDLETSGKNYNKAFFSENVKELLKTQSVYIKAVESLARERIAQIEGGL